MSMLTEALLRNDRSIPYILLIPWLVFAGSPLLLRSSTERNSNTGQFLLCFAAFLSLEIAILTTMLIALVSPWLEFLKMLENPRGYTFAEQVWRLGSGGVAGFVAILLVWRIFAGGRGALVRRAAAP